MRRWLFIAIGVCLLIAAAVGTLVYLDWQRENTMRAEKESHVAQPVDLGLSVKWASWDLGASAPEACGLEYKCSEPVFQRLIGSSNRSITSIPIVLRTVIAHRSDVFPQVSLFLRLVFYIVARTVVHRVVRRHLRHHDVGALRISRYQ